MAFNCGNACSEMSVEVMCHRSTAPPPGAETFANPAPGAAKALDPGPRQLGEHLLGLRIRVLFDQAAMRGDGHERPMRPEPRHMLGELGLRRQVDRAGVDLGGRRDAPRLDLQPRQARLRHAHPSLLGLSEACPRPCTARTGRGRASGAAGIRALHRARRALPPVPHRRSGQRGHRRKPGSARARAPWLPCGASHRPSPSSTPVPSSGAAVATPRGCRAGGSPARRCSRAGGAAPGIPPAPAARSRRRPTRIAGAATASPAPPSPRSPTGR